MKTHPPKKSVHDWQLLFCNTCQTLVCDVAQLTITWCKCNSRYFNIQYNCLGEVNATPCCETQSDGQVLTSALSPLKPVLQAERLSHGAGCTGQKIPEANGKWKSFKHTEILTKQEAELLAWVGPPQSNEAIPLEMPEHIVFRTCTYGRLAMLSSYVNTSLCLGKWNKTTPKLLQQSILDGYS